MICLLRSTDYDRPVTSSTHTTTMRYVARIMSDRSTHIAAMPGPRRIHPHRKNRLFIGAISMKAAQQTYSSNAGID